MTRLDAWRLAILEDADYQHARRQFEAALSAYRFDEARGLEIEMQAIADRIATRLRRMEMN